MFEGKNPICVSNEPFQKKCFYVNHPVHSIMIIKGGRGREERGHKKALDFVCLLNCIYFYVPLTFNSVEKDEVPALLVAVQV